MKVYFTASLTGKKFYESNYKKILSILKSFDFSVISDHILTEEKNKVLAKSHEEIISFYKKISNWINQSDVVVAEVSYPSTNVGHEITLALEKGKPVIMLNVEGKEPGLLDAISSDKAQLFSYNEDNLSEVLKDALKDAKDQMDVRFNFFISPKIGTYLDWIAKHRKLPRAVFLRRLIEEHMAKNKDYKA